MTSPTVRRRAAMLAAAVPVFLAAYVGLAVTRSAERVEERDEAQVAERALSEVSDPVAALCAADPSVRARLGPACLTASQVAAAPPDAAAETLAAAPPPPARGIDSTRQVGGRLLVVYTDGTVQDVGPVVGPAGADGGTGAAGVGVVDSSVVDGRLVLVFSDGRIVDVGRVVGDPGRGVASTAVVDGRLVVTYTDGDTEDAGPLPAGPPGELPSSYTRTFADGTSETCSRAGGDDTAPVYSCTDRS